MESNHNYGLSEKQLSNLNYSAWQKDTEAAIAVHAYAEKKRIDVEHSEERMKRLSDVQGCRELQKSKIVLTSDGKTCIVKEQFGAPVNETASFTTNTFVRCHRTENLEDFALYILITTNTGREIDLFIKKRDLTLNGINKKFDSAGVAFGFSRKKEGEIRLKYVQALLDNAGNWIVAPGAGWYFDTQRIKFAYPGDITWEVIENA